MTPILRARRALSVVWVAGTALCLGCGLLDTNSPDIVNPGDLDTPAGAAARRIGAITDFSFVMDGDGTQVDDGMILLAGLLSDEFIHSTTPPSEQETDQRNTALINPGLETVFLNLNRARVGSEEAAAALLKFSPDTTDDPGIPEMLALAGFTYISFEENFCTSVPFSTAHGDTVEYGPMFSRDSMISRAIERFDSALASPGIDVDIGYLAQVGRGRALLDSGNFAGASAAVAGVPIDFQYVTEHSETPQIQNNAIWSYSDGALWSLPNIEGNNGLAWHDLDDPRVPFDSIGDVGLDGITEQFSLTKYADATAPVVVADGIEAGLIVAEAQLQANNLPGMRTTLNNLRAFDPNLGLSPLPLPPNQTAATDVLFTERALWMFATGHRLGDMRRLVRQYGRAVDTVFPIGPYHKSGSYGNQVSFPVPQSEEKNPNFVRAACDPTVP